MGCLLSILAFVFGIAIFGSTASMASQVSVASDLPRPLVILQENGEGSYILGSNLTFVLYDTKQVIFRRYGDGEYELASVALNTDEFESLMATFNIDDDFYALDDDYEALGWTDLTYYEICVSDENRGDKCVSVYGDLSLIDPFSPNDIAQETRENTPDTFLQLFDTIMAFDHPDAETWMPEVFEVTIWEFDTSTNMIVEMPAEFETLFDPTAQWEEESYVIYVDREQYERLLVAVPGTSVVLIDRRTWAFHINYRYPHQETPDL